MSARPFHKRFHSDALAGFMSLSLEERDAYQTLLDMIYDRGGPVLDNERLLAGYMQCSPRKWRSIRESLIQKGKIQLTKDGCLTNARAEKEIENDAKTARKLAENGSKGGHVRAEKIKNGNENSGGEQAGLKPSPSLNHIPDTRDQKEEAPKPPQPDHPNPVIAAVLQAGRFVQIPNDVKLISEWAKAGADPELDIVPIVTREAESLIGRTGRGPIKLQVFDNAIRLHLAEAAAASERQRRSIRQMQRIEEDQRREQEEDRLASLRRTGCQPKQATA